MKEWSQGFPIKETPLNTDRDRFEIEQTGPLNIQVEGGGERIWVDGIRYDDGYLLDAKYVEKPERSPFIDGSNCPDFIRESVKEEVDEEFRRYGAVVNDESNPVQGLEVITNEEQAAPYFADLMGQHNVPGHVVVRSKQAQEDES